MSEEEILEPEAHHPYGPSRWPGLCVCPGYAPSKSSNSFAERGTAGHLAVETGDYSKLREEDREAAEWMTFELTRLTQGIETESEVKTRIPLYMVDDLALVGGITGTCDRRWTTEDGTLNVADFKMFSKVGEDYRAQLAGYILGGERPVDDLIVCHVFHGGSRVVETFEMTWEECLRYARAVAYAIAHPEDSRCRSKHCDRCARAADCPESAKAISFGALSAGRITREAVAANPAEAARLCDWLDAASKRIDDARSIIEKVAKEDGVAIEDPVTGIRYEVQRCQGRATVPPVSEIIDDMISKDGASRDGVLEKSTLTLTALRELVGKARAEEYVTRGEDTLKFVRKNGNKALKG